VSIMRTYPSSALFPYTTLFRSEFGNIIQYKYPGDDYKDLMVAVDSVIRRGYVDSTKLGVTGGSGGGLLTDWTVGHTHRFAAAARSEEHTSELQSLAYLVCRLLL